MPGDPVRRAMTPEELEAAFQSVPPEMVAETLDGELVVHPRPALRHSSVATTLAEELGPPFRRGRGGPGGWVILIEPEVHLGSRPDKVVPDLAGWRRTRMPEVPDEPASVVVPDWVCEVLSDRTEKDDRGRKRRLYRREKVGHLWLADPRIQTLEVYRYEQGRWVEVETFEGDAKVRAEPFDAIELDLALLWAR
jgi:Uma2 family endonuclease